MADRDRIEQFLTSVAGIARLDAPTIEPASGPTGPPLPQFTEMTALLQLSTTTVDKSVDKPRTLLRKPCASGLRHRSTRL